MKKILLIGPEVTDFLNPLAKKLKDQGFTVDVLEIRKIPRNDINKSNSYSSVLDYNRIIDKKITLVDILKYFLKKEFYSNFINKIFINYLEGNFRIIKSLKNSLNQQHSKKLFSQVFKKYDIINFHSITPSTLSFVNYTDRNNKIILSFWGSDLFQIWGWDSIQINGLKNYYEELRAMKRADLITVHNYEMERVVIAKFGSGIQNKVVRALFGMSDEIFDMIDKYSKDPADLKFIEKYGIPVNKIKITVGYCGDPICNHLFILNELEKIEHTTKEKIHLLIPMTYGNFSDDYMDEVKLALKKVNISYTIFDKYLSLDELGKLRVSSDIMIMMNKSDALSVSVCELLYAGNILISAVWLPYSPFRSEKIFFYETDFAQLGETTTYAVENFEKIKINLINNPDKVKKLNAVSHTWQKWAGLLDALS